MVVSLKLPESVEAFIVKAMSLVSKSTTGRGGGRGASASSFWLSSLGGGGGDMEWKLLLPSELWKITASGVAFLVVLYACEKLQVRRVREKEERAASEVSAAQLQQRLVEGDFKLMGERNSMDGGGGSMVKGRLRKQESSPIAQKMVVMSDLKAKVAELCKQLWPADRQPKLESFNELVKTTAKLAAEVGLEEFDAASATDPDKLAKMINAVDNAVM